ncbi:MAG: Uma2 family endonuclease [Chloroflexota bacterium]|nr:Uma2 family endonuclease [Chloroflexota bacterium]
MVAEPQPVSITALLDQLQYRDPLPLRLPPDWIITHERFEEIGRLNPDVLFETTADGRLIIMPFPDALSERTSSRLHTLVGVWALTAGGDVRGEAGGYYLSELERRAPDVSWVAPERVQARGQLEFAPDLVVEVRSPSQTIESQTDKMRMWMSYGVQLGWLVDPYEETVRIFRADGSVELVERPLELSGEDVCAGLTVDMNQVWQQL